MRTFLLLVLTVTALYVWQRQGNDAITATRPRTEKAVSTQAAPPISEHDWAKHSIDRAHEVANQVRETRQQNDQPWRKLGSSSLHSWRDETDLQIDVVAGESGLVDVFFELAARKFF